MPAGIYAHKKKSAEELWELAKPRFWSKVSKVDGQCWEWQGPRLTVSEKFPRLLPYGVFGIGNRTFRAHRIAYQFAVGPIPNGLCVLHKCDNPPCVNPEHLYAGTYQQNMNDRSARGRNKIAEKHLEKWRVERRQRYETNPNLRAVIGAASKKQYALGIGVGSPEAAAKRTSSIRARHKLPQHIEIEILTLRKSGQTISAIARRLSISLWKISKVCGYTRPNPPRKISARMTSWQ